MRTSQNSLLTHEIRLARAQNCLLPQATMTELLIRVLTYLELWSCFGTSIFGSKPFKFSSASVQLLFAYNIYKSINLWLYEDSIITWTPTCMWAQNLYTWYKTNLNLFHTSLKHVIYQTERILIFSSTYFHYRDGNNSGKTATTTVQPEGSI